MNNNYILEIADALIENHAALMVGAGLSKNAEKITATEKRFLDWNELSDQFYEAVYEKDRSPSKEYNNSLRLAQEVEIALGRPKLEKIIKGAVPDLEYAPSEVYVNLMEMPWRDVFTTNYDTLLERAAEKVTKSRYNVVVCQEDLVNSNDAPRIIKLHGSFPSTRPFIITEEDYRCYPKKFAALVNTVQQALLENVFCMIGFSCEDPNFIKWIGWIHDNLGKNNAQKIYMVSVSHITDVKRQLLFNQNILVVDLEELWPKKSKEERLKSFLDKLKEKVEEKDKKEKWFDLNQLKLSNNIDYVRKTKILNALNDSYPGWIVLPWEMKGKVDYLLQKMGGFYKFDGLPFSEKIDFAYEYVKFTDIVGRPLTSNVVKKFWNILDKYDELNDLNDQRIACKKQVVYLNLLRAFRELAEWGLYESCREKIDVSLLDYEGKQFLYVCDWWKTLYRFQTDNLVTLLDNWELDTGDVYWSMIKGSLYALVGEISKADSILTENLIVVRKGLFRADKKEYLSSLENTLVSLINFIRMGTRTNKDKTEECVYEGDVSWGNENEKYYLSLKAEEKEKARFEIKDNFDLTRTYVTHIGTDNARVVHAMEYLRFLEQTGHPFRLQNVTNTKGLHSTIKILASCYPHWCLIQMLIAQDTKMLDVLFGRAKLANLSQKYIDATTEDYLDVIQVVVKNVKPKTFFFEKSIYDQAAAVLPEIVARFCYKCSTGMLDKILEAMLELCLSNVRTNFKGMDKIFKGLMHAYTVREQGERIDKILKFPMDVDRVTHYCDPVCFVSKPKEKYSLDAELYDDVMFRIKEMLGENENEKKNSAVNRLIVLAQIINLNERDKEYICGILEKEDSLENDSILYAIDPLKYSDKKMEIFNKTIQRMQLDSNELNYAKGSYDYSDLISVMKDMDIHNIDILNAFSVMIKLVKANLKSSWDDKPETDTRIRESFIIASGLLVMKSKTDKGLTKKEKKQAGVYLTELNKYFQGEVISSTLWSCLGVDTGNNQKELYKNFCLCENSGLNNAACFYNVLYVNNYSIESNEELLNCTQDLFKIALYKMSDGDSNDILPALKLCYSLLQYSIFPDSEVEVLLNTLLKIQQLTSISKDNDEKNAIYKLRCRIEACNIAREMYALGIKSNVLEQWKLISEDKAEFCEIRNIVFS